MEGMGVGSVVHYFTSSSLSRDDFISCVAAIIIEIDGLNSDKLNSVGLFVIDPLVGTYLLTHVPYSPPENRIPQTWHWPEKV